MYGGSITLTQMFNYLVEEFNNTTGKEKNIVVKAIPKSGSIDSVLAQQLPTNSGPDVVAISDEYFKKYTRYLENLNGKIDEAAIKDYYPELIRRYYYDFEKNTSNMNDPLYGVPAYNDATVLYFNKSVLKKNGVICISVDADNLDDFNAGKIKDLNGKTKADYGINIEIPAKVFFRSENPFVPEEGETDGSSWTLPGSGEILIFNDRIPMNWDEIEDLGLICTKSRNASSQSQYGYYTEWWFNYGWSVGGDCLTDLTGEGEWVYTLASDVPNYVVCEGKTYTGLYRGIQYSAGETLELRDILNAKPGDKISCETNDGTGFYFTVNGVKSTVRDFSREISGGILKELPSIKKHFPDFVFYQQLEDLMFALIRQYSAELILLPISHPED